MFIPKSVGDLLCRMPTGSFEAVTSRAVKVTVLPKQVLFDGCDAHGHLYIVLTGAIELTSFNTDSEALVGLAGPGDAVGCAAFATGHAEGTRATALNPATAWAWHRRVLLDIARSDKHITDWLLTIPAIAVRHLQDSLDARRFSAGSSRIAASLLRWTEVTGMDQMASPLVRVDQAMLARMAGVKRQTVSEAFSGFRARGWLAASSRMEWTILDLAALRNHARR
ncbi:Crp/Fnr family transcriptional regulator [Phytomonospora sp. NPDC050363]|uniref:Crp/Fnr family transcriptional regulator n=1 Tax=Phytomonospora sp. NPDC050363 TaxID=3155642 RepID=UPI003407B7E7